MKIIIKKQKNKKQKTAIKRNESNRIIKDQWTFHIIICLRANRKYHLLYLVTRLTDSDIFGYGDCERDRERERRCQTNRCIEKHILKWKRGGGGGGGALWVPGNQFNFAPMTLCRIRIAY